MVLAVAVEGGRGDGGGDDDTEEEEVGGGCLKEDDPGHSDGTGLWLAGALCISRAAYSEKTFAAHCFLGYL